MAGGKDGRIGFDFAASILASRSRAGRCNLRQPFAGFYHSRERANDGLHAVDGAIAATARAANNHTLNDQDQNNFAPRVGFAYSPLSATGW